MLRKALKYEFVASWRDFIWVYVALLLCALLAPLSFRYEFTLEAVRALSALALFGIGIAVTVIVIISMFRIFNRNMFSDQGYLTLSLPMKSSTLVASKLIAGTAWIVITGIVCMIMLVIAAAVGLGNAFWIGFNMIPFDFLRQEAPHFVLLALLSILSVVNTLALLYLSCTVARVGMFRKFRVLAGILCFFILSWIEGVAGGRLMKIEITDATFMGMDPYTAAHTALAQLTAAIWPSVIATVIFTAAFIAAIIWILQKKLEIS